MRPFSLIYLIFLIPTFAVACATSEPTPTPTPSATPVASPIAESTPETIPTPQVTNSEPLADESRELMDAALLTFLGEDGAVRKMGESGDESYIPVLIEFLRFPWLLEPQTRVTLLSSLAKLNGQEYPQLTPEQREWNWWVEWLGRHPEVHPPAGYDGWKGSLFSYVVNSETGDFFSDGVKARIRLEEIVWGGVARDGIPDLTNPPIVSAQEATYLHLSDRVFGVSINGEHRAYPLRVLNLHEMANDVVGGVPFALAY